MAYISFLLQRTKSVSPVRVLKNRFFGSICALLHRIRIGSVSAKTAPNSSCKTEQSSSSNQSRELRELRLQIKEASAASDDQKTQALLHVYEFFVMALTLPDSYCANTRISISRLIDDRLRPLTLRVNAQR